ncbi:MAG: iron chelate uptake ABC transporter family permease subunit [Planctomycetota bacterium]
MTACRLGLVLLLSALVCLISLLVQVGAGSYGLDMGLAWSALVSPSVWGDPALLWALVTGGASSDLDTGTVVVWSIRLPRVLAAMAVGAALAVSGAVFQAITRNDLASPYILGVSAGAGLTALLVMVLASVLQPWLPLLAALGGSLAFLLVYAVAWRGGASPVRLVLAGVVVATILTSLQTAVHLFADNVAVVHNAIAWTTGSLVGVDWPPLLRALPWLLPALAALLLAARQLDLISLGDRVAAGVGMPVERVRFLLAALAVLLASASVTIAGTVGFVGLIVPHVARGLVGTDHRRLLPAAAACGAALLCAADAIARLAFSPTQVPVGILTGLLGGGYFLLLMRRRGIGGLGRRGRRRLSTTPAPAAAAGLQAEAISAGYDGPPVLHDISLQAPAGALTVLVGANGSGKSTLVKTIAGQVPALSGSVHFAGDDLLVLTQRQRACRLAILQQEHDIPSGLTVEQLVWHGRHAHRGLFGVTRSSDAAAVQRALALAEAGPLRDRELQSLSGGQRQLAWLAMALAQEAPLLALDEPTTYLDIGHQYHLLQLLQRLSREQGITVLAVLHDLDLACRFADQLVLLAEGRIQAAGQAAAVLTPERLARCFGISGQVAVGRTPCLRIDGLAQTPC